MFDITKIGEHDRVKVLSSVVRGYGLRSEL
jgi:hypothetical protein